MGGEATLELAGTFSGEAIRPLLLNVASDDIGAFLSQPPGDYQPEALRCAGDDRDPAFIPATLRRLRERQRLERLLHHGFPPGSLANIFPDQVGCAMKMNTGTQNAHRQRGGILSVWLDIGLVRFLRLGVLANLIGAPLATATTGLIGL